MPARAISLAVTGGRVVASISVGSVDIGGKSASMAPRTLATCCCVSREPRRAISVTVAASLRSVTP